MTNQIRNPNSEIRIPNSRVFFGVVFLFMSGCGGKLYEDRLANTSILLAHIGHLKDNLHDKWVDGETGVSLRVPLQFSMLPPPAKPEPAPEDKSKPKDKTKEEEIHDDRQPKYMNVELPGLRGAFEARVKLFVDNNPDATGDAWLYVMTNHYLAERPDDAREFTQSVIKNIAEAVHLSSPETEAYESVRYPAKVGNFVKPVKYTKVLIAPTDPVGGLVRQFVVYMYEQNDIHVVVLFVLPQNIDSSEKLETERIPLCLETLEVFGTKLTLPTGGSGAPVGGAAPTF